MKMKDVKCTYCQQEFDSKDPIFEIMIAKHNEFHSQRVIHSIGDNGQRYETNVNTKKGIPKYEKI